MCYRYGMLVISLILIAMQGFSQSPGCNPASATCGPLVQQTIVDAGHGAVQGHVTCGGTAPFPCFIVYTPNQTPIDPRDYTSSTIGQLVPIDKDGKEGPPISILGYLGTDKENPSTHIFLLKK
jgi:hypothetical protein